MQYTLLRLKAHSLFKKKKKKSHDEKKVRTTTTKKNRTKGSELGGVSFGVTRLAVTFLAEGFGILKVASGRVGSLSLFPATSEHRDTTSFTGARYSLRILRLNAVVKSVRSKLCRFYSGRCDASGRSVQR